MKKQLLIVLTFFIIGLSLNAQTIFNNYSPDRLLSSSYTIRTIDLDNNGTDDFRFHFDFDTVAGESTIYLETFDENEILIHNINSLPPPLLYSPAIITTNVIMALHPSLANVDPLLPAEILSTLGDTAYWSSSSSIDHNALIFFSTPNAGGLTITFGMSISACYDNYYCRVKQPGANNYIYGYIQAWGAASPPPLYEPWLYVGGTGYNPTINQTAVINTACTVVTNFEPGPQVGELPTGIFNLSKNTIFSVYPNPANSQINVKADAKLLGSVYIVYDNVGKVVLSGKINSINTIIELGNLSGGIYLFSVGDNLKQTLKIIKE